MAKNDVRVTDNPKLKQKALSDGTLSLYLDYYLGRVEERDITTGEIKSKVKRKREYLKLTLLSNPRTPLERQMNKENLETAMKIRQLRDDELKASGYGIVIKRKKTEPNFLDYFQSYIDNYTKKDIRMIQIAFQRFKDFLEATPEYKGYSTKIKPSQMDRDMMLLFTEYLESRSRGEGAKSIWQRFKKVVNHAVEHDVMAKDPTKGISIKVDEGMLRKDVLSMDEIQTLINTHYDNENPIIQRAFIFCAITGMRFCDVKDLKYSNIDYSNRIMKFEQNKVMGHSSNSGVMIPLSDTMLNLIGESPETDGLIFTLPSYEACLKALKRWVKRAGIQKKISWHCARHSFGTNLLINGSNVKVVQSLLGHSTLRYTERYMRAVDEQKQQAINSMNFKL